MRVIVQRSPISYDGYDVWFITETAIPPRTLVAQFTPTENGSARLDWQEHAEGTDAPPTLRLSGQEAQMLRNGLDEYGPTTSEALTLARDAVKVRDRLLTLIEGLTLGEHRTGG